MRESGLLRRAGLLAVALLVVWSVLAPLTNRSLARTSAAGALGAVPATKVVVFHPAGTSGRVVSGACAMGESMALDRADAWRCMVGNEIYDPCFSPAPHATTVICDASPTKPIGFTVRLSQPLPTHGAAHNAQPWLLKLGDGTLCGFLTGATGEVAGERLNYGCTAKTYVLGTPRAQGKIWYGTVVTLGANFKPVAIYAISIATIWK